jgi:hypothetical protein
MSFKFLDINRKTMGKKIVRMEMASSFAVMSWLSK